MSAPYAVQIVAIEKRTHGPKRSVPGGVSPGVGTKLGTASSIYSLGLRWSQLAVRAYDSCPGRHLDFLR